MGWNLPHLVRQTMQAIRERRPEIEVFHMHRHNQRGQTLASYYEALMLGATEFDTCIGGMGGCPYCGNGRSAGHVPSEDFVDLCHEMGIQTGFNLGKLIEEAAHSRNGPEVYAGQLSPWREGDALRSLEADQKSTKDAD